jgi:hypothetical protein
MGNRLPRRRVDTAQVRAKLAAARLKPVNLRIAAALLYNQLGGDSRSSMLGPVYIRKLSETASMLAAVLDIYRLDKGRLVRLAKPELAGAQFLDGGNALRTAAGILHHPLAVRRSEAVEAIERLVSVNVET